MTDHTNDQDNTENSLGYSGQVDPHLSHTEADQMLRNDQAEGIQNFIDALEMKNQVSQATALSLLKTLVKETMTSNAEKIADAMRMLEWDKLTAGGDDLSVIASRAANFFDTQPGLEVFNFVVKTLSKTSDSMI
jgi:hypothetical protein